MQEGPKPKPMTAIKQEDKIEQFDAGKVVELSSDPSEEEFGDKSMKWEQGQITSAAVSAAEQKKKTAKSTATIIREHEEIKNDFTEIPFLQ